MMWAGYRAAFKKAFVIAVLVSLVGCTALKRCAYEGFDRDEWQKPDQVIRALGLHPGDRVVDLGSGSGYFTFRLADAVGPTGAVYAVDVDAEMNAYLEEQIAERSYDQVSVILARPDDPGIPDPGVDLIFTCNAYHHLPDRATYFARLRKYLGPGGRVAIIDFTDEGWLHALIGHNTPREVIEQEMAEAGYTLVQEFDFLSEQTFLVFSPSQSSERLPPHFSWIPRGIDLSRAISAFMREGPPTSHRVALRPGSP